MNCLSPKTAEKNNENQVDRREVINARQQITTPAPTTTVTSGPPQQQPYPKGQQGGHHRSRHVLHLGNVGKPDSRKLGFSRSVSSNSSDGSVSRSRCRDNRKKLSTNARKLLQPHRQAPYRYTKGGARQRPNATDLNFDVFYCTVYGT